MIRKKKKKRWKKKTPNLKRYLFYCGAAFNDVDLAGFNAY